MMMRFKQLTLLCGDFLALWAGLYLAAATREFNLTPNNWLALSESFLPLFGLAVVILFIIGLYDVGRAKNSWGFFESISLTAAIWLLLGVIFFYINPNATLAPKTILALGTIFCFGLIALWRYIYNRFLSASILRTRVLFIGLTPEVSELVALFQREPARGFVVLGCIAANLQTTGLPGAANLNVATAATLEEILKLSPRVFPDIIVIAPGEDSALLRQELYALLFNQISVLDLAEFYERIFRRVPPFTFSESWFLTHLNEQANKIYDRARLLFDYLVAALMAIIFLATWPLLALLIKITSSGTILFKQIRVGRGQTNFTMYKYRTMRSLAADGSAEVSGPEFAKNNDTRVTKFGKFLRQTRLDELPQCLNILRGEMGLIGPRPERPEFVEALKREMPFYSLRHLIKPGLTGWAQLQQSYYGNISENLKKLEYDLYYIKNRGPWLDLAIILRTFNILFRMIGR